MSAPSMRCASGSACGEVGLRRLGQVDLVPQQADAAGLGRRGMALAVPGVDRDVVVVAGDRHEGHLRVGLDDVEAQAIDVEALRRREVLGLEVDVAHHGAGIEPGPALAR